MGLILNNVSGSATLSNKIGVTGSIKFGDPGQGGSGAAGAHIPAAPPGCTFFVSGAKSSANAGLMNNKRFAAFSGDAHVSGTLFLGDGSSGDSKLYGATIGMAGGTAAMDAGFSTAKMRTDDVMLFAATGSLHCLMKSGKIYPLLSGSDFTAPAAGSDTQVQYNDGGSTLAGAPDLTFAKATGDVTIGAATGDAKLMFRDSGNYIYSNADGDFDMINTDGSAANSILIDCNAGGITIDGHTGVLIDASNSGNVEINVTAADDILIGNDSVACDVLIGQAAATEIDLTGIVVDINGGATGVTIDALDAGTIDIGVSAAGASDTSNINIGTSATGRTITIGADASTKVDVNALIIELDSAGTIILNSATTTDIDSTGILSLNSGAVINIGNDDDDFAINIGGTGTRTITLGSATSTLALNTTGGASTVTVKANTASAMKWSDGTDDLLSINSSALATYGTEAHIVVGHSGGTANEVALVPGADNVFNLGTAALRWANIYTGDLHLANDRGNWTLVEENDMLTLRNNKTGKWYRVAMEEIDPTGRDAGMNGAPS